MDPAGVVENARNAADPEPIASGLGSTGVDHDADLMAFTDAVVLRDHDELPGARARLEAAVGRQAADRAALVASNFSMMNRVVDAVGAPVGRGMADLGGEMGLTIPEHLLAG